MFAKRKRTLWISFFAAVLILSAGLFWFTSRSKAMTIDEAAALAKKAVPESAAYADGRESENKFTTVFLDNDNKERYKIDVSKKTKQVKKIEMERYDDSGSKTVSLTEEDVKKIIGDKFSGITGTNIKLDTDDGLYKYEVKFTGDNFYGEADVNPETGILLEYTFKKGAAITIPKNGGNNKAADVGVPLTKEQAVDAALNASGGGLFKDFEIEKEHGKYYYEVEIIKDNAEIEYVIDPETEKIISENNYKNFSSNEKETPKTKEDKNRYISLSDLENIVNAKAKTYGASGAKIEELELGKENGRNVYEGDAILEDKYGKYEFEIDAAAGVIVKWEKDTEENYIEDIDDDDDDNDDD